MTTSQSRTLRKAGAVALSLALAMSTLAITPASAAKKVKLAKTKITVNVGKTKKVKIKNVNKKQVKKLTVKSSKKAVATAKKAGKVAIKVTGKKKGSAKVTANLKLKTKVAGKKAYKLTLKVTVKKAATPVEPTVAPTAAPTPVVSGASITLDKTAYSVATGASVTVTAKLLPETSNEAVTWSIDDQKIATVSGGAATVNGVATATLTGVAEGTTRLYAAIGAARQVATVEVTKNHITAKIESAKMNTSDSVEITFDNFKADTEGFGYDKIEVVRATSAGNRNDKVINKLSEGADGKIYTVQVQDPFTDGDKVTVKYGDTSATFDAVIKDPAQATITTVQAEKDKPTAIEFKLWDANGTDVTAANKANFDSQIELSVEEDKAGTDTNSLNATDGFKITMSTLNGTAKVKLVYKNADGKELFNTTQLITCVPTQATKGTFKFKGNADGTKEISTGVHVAKFYKGKDLDKAEVYVDGTTSIWAFAADESGNAIEYDAYDADAQADTVISVETEVTEGKYTKINIGGLKVGTTTINVSAEKYGVKAYYSIPVTVKEAPKFDKLVTEYSRKELTNAIESGYAAKITVYAKDQYGNNLDASQYLPKTEEVSKIPTGGVYDFTWVGQTGTLGNEGMIYTFKAFSGTTPSVSGTYKLDLPYYDEKNKKDAKCPITITVKDVQATLNADAGFSADYSVELVDEYGLEVKEFDNNKQTGLTAKIVAKTKSKLFLGFVNADGSIGDESESPIADNKISDMSFTVTKGGKQAWFTSGGEARLYDYKNPDDANYDRQAVTGKSEISFDNIGTGDKEYGLNDSYYADAATYSIKLAYKLGTATKSPLTRNFTIVDKLKENTPVLTPKTWKVEGLDIDSYKSVLVANCDINNNNGASASVGTIAEGKDATDKSQYVKSFWVSEDGISYCVKCTGTFNLAS